MGFVTFCKIMSSASSSSSSSSAGAELRDALKRAREACDAVDHEKARCKLRALLAMVEPQMGKDRLQRGRKPTLRLAGVHPWELLCQDVSGALHAFLSSYKAMGLGSATGDDIADDICPAAKIPCPRRILNVYVGFYRSTTSLKRRE